MGKKTWYVAIQIQTEKMEVLASLIWVPCTIKLKT